MEEELDFARVLADFTYKPNFYLSIYSVKLDRVLGYPREHRLRALMLVENSRTSFQPWEVVPLTRDPDIISLTYNRPVLAPDLGGVVGYSPRRPVIEVQGNFVIPPNFFGAGDEIVFLDWLVQILRDMEIHELDEWARYKGKLLHDPHDIKL